MLKRTILDTIHSRHLVTDHFDHDTTYSRNAEIVNFNHDTFPVVILSPISPLEEGHPGPNLLYSPLEGEGASSISANVTEVT
jgi:hypothetical protein